MGRSRGRKSLRPSARAVPAGRGDPAALSGAVGIVDVSLHAGRVTDRPGAGGAAPPSGPKPPRHRPPTPRPPQPVGYLILARRVALGPRTRGARDCLIRARAAPLPRLPLRRARPWGVLPEFWGLSFVAPWLPGPGRQEKPGGDGSGPGVVSSLWPGPGPVHGC